MIDYGGSGSGNVLQTRNKYKNLGMTYHSALDCVNHDNGASDLYYLTEDFYFEVLNTGNYVQAHETSASRESPFSAQTATNSFVLATFSSIG